MSTRVLVVDDSVLFRRVISGALSGLSGVEVAGTASNGKLGLAQLAALQPDLMTLDIEMPEMNGIEVLETLRRSSTETCVIVLSSQTSKGSRMTMKALELGAFDFVAKPEASSPEESQQVLRERLQPIVRAYERRREIRQLLAGGRSMGIAQGPLAAPGAGPGTIASPSGALRTRAPLVLIGVSTGGPAALAQLLPALPADLRAPIFIVQHMPPMFTEALAQSLQSKCSIRVKEAADKEVAQRGWAYVAPGGRQMKLAPGPAPGEVVIRLTNDPPENNCRPSVDYLFRSAALHFPGRSVAAILTGMGNDGAQGVRLLKSSACVTIAQDEATCVVYGMPREAALTGAVDQVLPLSKIAPAIVRAVEEAST